MSQQFSIEPISEQNFDDFLYLIDQLAEYEHLTPPGEDAKKRLKDHGLGETKLYEAYLGRLGDKYIGYLILFFTYSSFLAKPTLYIEDIFFLQEHRRQGFGQQMFDLCVNIAKERQCGRVEWCVLTWNLPAIQFYEKNRAKKLDWYFYRFDQDQIQNYPNH